MITVRKLAGDEVPDALNLVKEVFFAEGNLGFSHQGAQSFLEFVSEHGASLSWFGAYERTLIGALGYDPDTCHISLLFVRSESQRRGTARKLAEALFDDADSKAIRRITVNAAVSAVPAYEAIGFESYGEERTKDGITSLPMEYLRGMEYLGKSVNVTVESPIGSLHPHYPDVQYPCNCGYVDEVLAETGEYQDAYVIGVNEPTDSFHGVVAAMVYRINDCHARWVITESKVYDRQEVIDTIGELEQYQETRIIWLGE